MVRDWIESYRLVYEQKYRLSYCDHICGYSVGGKLCTRLVRMSESVSANQRYSMMGNCTIVHRYVMG